MLDRDLCIQLLVPSPEGSRLLMMRDMTREVTFDDQGLVPPHEKDQIFDYYKCEEILFMPG